MEVSGLIHHIGETQVISDKFKKRDIVLKLDASTPYPQFVQFQVTQAKCDVLNGYSIGDEVTVQFNLKGREHNGKFYNQLEVWKLEKIWSSQGAANANPSFSTGSNKVEDSSDLPF